MEDLEIKDITIDKIKNALEKASPYGSVEIVIQANLIVQISYRHIEKTYSDYKEVEFRNTLETDKFGNIVKRKL